MKEYTTITEVKPTFVLYLNENASDKINAGLIYEGIKEATGLFITIISNDFTDARINGTTTVEGRNTVVKINVEGNKASVTVTEYNIKEV